MIEADRARTRASRWPTAPARTSAPTACRSPRSSAGLPGFEPQWTVQRGIEELLDAYRAHGLTIEDFLSSRFQRIMRIRELLDAGELDEDLRWT